MRTACKSETLSRRAFSLIEVLITVIIMGILTAVAVPSFVDSLMYHRAENGARRIKADLELALRQARTQSTDQTVAFVVSEDRYVLAGLPDLNRPSQTYEVDLADPPYEVSLTAAQFNDSSDPDVSFNGFRQPDSGGTVTIQAGQYTKQIVLDSSTGDVTIQ